MESRNITNIVGFNKLICVQEWVHRLSSWLKDFLTGQNHSGMQNYGLFNLHTGMDKLLCCFLNQPVNFCTVTRLQIKTWLILCTLAPNRSCEWWCTRTVQHEASAQSKCETQLSLSSAGNSILRQEWTAVFRVWNKLQYLTTDLSQGYCAPVADQDRNGEGNSPVLDIEV